MTKREGKRKRLTFEMTDEYSERLEQMAKTMGVSRIDVVRFALGILDFAFDARKNGRRLGVVDAEAKMTTEIVGFGFGLGMKQ